MIVKGKLTILALHSLNKGLVKIVLIVPGLRITPFIYYLEVVALLIEMEKSYDTMPNFTAADCKYMSIQSL